MEFIPVKAAVNALRAGHGALYPAAAALRKRLAAGLVRAQASAKSIDRKPASDLTVESGFWGAGAMHQHEDWNGGDFIASIPRDERHLMFRRVEVFGLLVAREDVLAMGGVFDPSRAGDAFGSDGAANTAPEVIHEAGRGRGGGRPPKYDWDGMLAALLRVADLDGLDSFNTVTDFENWALDWFKSAGVYPDRSNVNRNISKVANAFLNKR